MSHADLTETEIDPELLEEAYARAAAAWPGVTLPRPRFFEHLTSRLPAGAPVRDAVAAVQAGDLYLACACLSGDPAALDAFEHTYRDVIAVSLARLKLPAADRDDIAQNLRVAFFLKKTLAGYSGRGALRGWIRSAATRAAIDLVDSRKRRPDDEEEILGALPTTGNVELDLVRRRFGAAFRAAFAESLAALTAGDRLILAQHYVDDLSIDQLAAVLGVHRATAARRVARLREALLEGTRKRLTHALHIDPVTFDSLMRDAGSQLDVSVFRLLRP